MNQILSFLSGKKLHLIALATIVYASLGLLLGYFDVQHATELILGASGASAFRSAITKVGVK